MIGIGNLKNKLYISVIFVAKPKNFVIFAFMSRCPVLFNGNFCMNLFSVDSDEVMKRGDEAFNSSSL
jgi:hypothetical protein